MSNIFIVLTSQDIVSIFPLFYPARKWLQYVVNHSHFSWDLEGISQNPHLNMNIIEKYLCHYIPHVELGKMQSVPKSKHSMELERNV